MAGSFLLYLKEGSDWFICVWIQWFFLLTSLVLIGLYLVQFNIPYGRYNKTRINLFNIYISAKLAWCIQEIPAVIVPLYCLLNVGGAQVGEFNPNIILFGMFLMHYLQRTFIYPLCLNGGKPSPLSVVTAAFIVCTLNGYLQARSLTQFYHYDTSWLWNPAFILGHLLFLLGMAINIHSDSILRNLRKPGETGYKIPQGGAFEYVSGANFFGEALEWWGFAIACWTPPALVFAVMTTVMIGTRALTHHRYYLEKFENYPKTRKAFIPFLL